MERPGFLVLSTRVDLVHSEGHETHNRHYGKIRNGFCSCLQDSENQEGSPVVCKSEAL